MTWLSWSWSLLSSLMLILVSFLGLGFTLHYNFFFLLWQTNMALEISKAIFVCRISLDLVHNCHTVLTTIDCRAYIAYLKSHQHHHWQLKWWPTAGYKPLPFKRHQLVLCYSHPCKFPSTVSVSSTHLANGLPRPLVLPLGHHSVTQVTRSGQVPSITLISQYGLQCLPLLSCY